MTTALPTGSSPWLRAWRIAVCVVLVAGVATLHAGWWAGKTWGLHGIPAAAACLLLGLGLDSALALLLRLHRPPAEALRWLVSSEAWRALTTRLVVCVTIVALFYNLEWWRGRRAWADVEREAARRGESLDARGAPREQVPDEENFARAPGFEPLHRILTAPVEYVEDLLQPDLGPLAEVAAWKGKSHGSGRPGQRPALAPWTLGGEVDFTRWLKYWPSVPETAGNQKGSSLEFADRRGAAVEALRRLEKFDPALEELRQYARRPYCRFPLDYPRQMWRDDPVVEVLGGYLRLVSLRATALVATGRAEEAWEETQLALRLIDHSRQQPHSLRGIMLVGLQLDALQPVWEAARARIWSAARWAELQKQLQSLDLLSDYPMNVRNDAAASADLLEAFVPARTGGSSVPRALRSDPEKQGIYRLIELVVPSGWSLMDQAAGWQLYFEVTSRTVDAASRKVAPWPDSHQRWRRTTSDPLFPIFIAPKLHQLGQDAALGFAMAQTAIDQARLACALERYRRDHGRYPPRLAELTPQHADAIPHDVMSSSELRYRSVNEGFVLYSVGGNRVDDEGQPGGRQWAGLMDPSSGDWVWAGGPGTRKSLETEPVGKP